MVAGADVDLKYAGYRILGLVADRVVAVAVWKLGRIDERWCADLEI